MLAGVMVGCRNSRSNGREFDFRRGRNRVTIRLGKLFSPI